LQWGKHPADPAPHAALPLAAFAPIAADASLAAAFASASTSAATAAAAVPTTAAAAAAAAAAGGVAAGGPLAGGRRGGGLRRLSEIDYSLENKPVGAGVIVILVFGLLTVVALFLSAAMPPVKRCAVGCGAIVVFCSVLALLFLYPQVRILTDNEHM